jgi:hypothetical protein
MRAFRRFLTKLLAHRAHGSASFVVRHVRNADTVDHGRSGCVPDHELTGCGDGRAAREDARSGDSELK